MDDQLCIIIPIYKRTLNLRTTKALEHNLKRIGKTPCYFIAPKNLKTEFYYHHFGRLPILRFSDKHFKSTKTYNKLMLMPSFYQHFERYRYICICQTDALILRDTDYVLEMIRKGFDYWGAPWYPSHRIPLYKFKAKRINLIWERHAKKYVIDVGNGGLSLRNVKKTIHLLNHHPLARRIWNQNEDYFFAVMGRYFDSDYTIAPSRFARKFALETDMKKIMQHGGGVPFGVHAWEKVYPQLLEEAMLNGNVQNM